MPMLCAMPLIFFIMRAVVCRYAFTRFEMLLLSLMLYAIIFAAPRLFSRYIDIILFDYVYITALQRIAAVGHALMFIFFIRDYFDS